MELRCSVRLLSRRRHYPSRFHWRHVGARPEVAPRHRHVRLRWEILPVGGNERRRLFGGRTDASHRRVRHRFRLSHGVHHRRAVYLWCRVSEVERSGVRAGFGDVRAGLGFSRSAEVYTGRGATISCRCHLCVKQRSFKIKMINRGPGQSLSLSLSTRFQHINFTIRVRILNKWCSQKSVLFQLRLFTKQSLI